VAWSKNEKGPGEPVNIFDVGKRTWNALYYRDKEQTVRAKKVRGVQGTGVIRKRENEGGGVRDREEEKSLGSKGLNPLVNRGAQKTAFSGVDLVRKGLYERGEPKKRKSPGGKHRTHHPEIWDASKLSSKGTSIRGQREDLLNLEGRNRLQFETTDGGKLRPGGSSSRQRRSRPSQVKETPGGNFKRKEGVRGESQS